MTDTSSPEIPPEVWEIAAGCVPMPFALRPDETQELVARAIASYGQRRAQEEREMASEEIERLTFVVKALQDLIQKAVAVTVEAGITPTQDKNRNSGPEVGAGVGKNIE